MNQMLKLSEKEFKAAIIKCFANNYKLSQNKLRKQKISAEKSKLFFKNHMETTELKNTITNKNLTRIAQQQNGDDRRQNQQT